MKNSIILILISMFFLSCSNDNNNDSVVGKWKVINRFDSSDAEIELTPCDDIRVIRFYKDNSFGFYNITDEQQPGTLCGESFAGVYQWYKLENGKYLVTPGQQSVYTFDGSRLIEINTINNQKAVLKRIF
ncbi:MAG: hypothetical protein ABWY22_11505 [Flavobacterium sp.]